MSQPPISGSPYQGGYQQSQQSNHLHPVTSVPVTGMPGGMAAPPEPARGSKPILVTGLAVIVVAALGIGAVLMFGFGGPSQSPTEVTEAYMNKILEADIEGALQYRCQADVDKKKKQWGGDTPSQEALDDAEENAKGLSFEIVEGSEKITGETAKVEAEVESQGDSDLTSTLIWNLDLVDDAWLLCGEPGEKDKSTD